MTDSAYEKKYNEMVNSPLEGLIIRMAIPSIISLLITGIYNLADTYFVGQIGTSATGAVGIVYPLMTLIMALGLMFGKGTGTLMGRQLGAGQPQKAEQTAVSGLSFCVLVGILLGAICWLTIDPLVNLLGSSESMHAYAVTYAGFILIGMPFRAGQSCMDCILRFQGYAKRSMYGMAVGAILNIILDPLLIFTLGMGFAGAGMATMIGEITSFVVLFIQCRSKDCIPFRLSNADLSFESFKSIIRGGFASLLKNGLSSFAAILLNNSAVVYGDAVIAAFSIVTRLVHMCQTMFFGLGEGFQSVCSYNFGAKRYDRVKKGFWFCIKAGLLLFVFMLIAQIIPRQIIAVFRRDDETVISVGAAILRAQTASLVLLPVCSAGFVMLQAIGRNRDSAILGCGRQGLFLVPLIIILPRLFGLPGLIAVQPCSDICATLLGSWILWKNMKMLDKLEKDKEKL